MAGNNWYSAIVVLQDTWPKNEPPYALIIPKHRGFTTQVLYKNKIAQEFVKASSFFKWPHQKLFLHHNILSRPGMTAVREM